MSKTTITLFFALVFSNAAVIFADIGGNHLIPNSPGRCWRVHHRNFNVSGNLDSAIMFKFVTVGGTGETDDIITYELTFKENFDKTSGGWDESKTRVYTGSGLIKTISHGRVRFEIYVDLGNGEPPLTVQGYYHPGEGTSDYDDRIAIGFPPEITQDVAAEDDCNEMLGEGGASTNGLGS